MELTYSHLWTKASYWQGQLDESSQHLTACTVGPLGFYECEHMSFSLMNAPATFQSLMESPPQLLHHLPS